MLDVRVGALGAWNGGREDEHLEGRRGHGDEAEVFAAVQPPDLAVPHARAAVAVRVAVLAVAALAAAVTGVTPDVQYLPNRKLRARRAVLLRFYLMNGTLRSLCEDCFFAAAYSEANRRL